MGDFQRMWPGFLDYSIDRIAVITSFDFPALVIDPFANLSLSEVVDVRVAKFSKEISKVILREQYMSTVLLSSVTASLAGNLLCTLQIFWSIVMIILK